MHPPPEPSDQMRAQAERLRGPDGRYLLPPTPASAPWTGGRLLRVGRAFALLRQDTWAPDVLQRAVLGDHTGTLDRVVLPDPSTPGAAASVAELVRLAARYTDADRLPGRTQLVVRWPSGDTGTAAAFAAAGLRLDALMGERAAEPLPGHPVAGVTVRIAAPADVPAVVDLAVEETRYHVAISPFTRDVDAVRGWTSSAVLAADPAHPVFVAERDGRVVGYAACELVDTPDDGLVHPLPPGRTGHLRSVGVTAAGRGRGTGTALVHAAGPVQARWNRGARR
ncbi:acetyltransferase (GNAT) family protein [Pseudonocardia autotrophica]|uniref:N-acetyltransferase domain-containing protein n=2 Tax=Pseudonocardia TaxID=1847 RepID=A0A1Y2NA19_PSEAH|nr:hypothetical protein BG845_00191 [Pseudonocardia autotrophica]TDN74199.1 acetyltransferase (GNAT) family protein [Pseudonocardia autotrophica]